jgi:prevent-host-death family protein
VDTQTYTVSEARDNFAEVMNRVTYGEQAAVITKNGKEKAAIVPYRLLALLTRIEAALDLEKAQEALDDFESNGGVSLDQLKADLGLVASQPTGGHLGKLPRASGARRKSRTKAPR